MTTPIPRDVVNYVRNVFLVCNRRIGRKIAAVPNSSEQSLDLTMIEQLSQFSAPTILPSDWTVRIDIHYLGGRRHFGRWEVADIGVLLFLRRAGKLVRSKVALFQSKRLYPDSGDVDEEEAADYHVGFARLVPAGPSTSPMTIQHVFTFSEQSKYRALHVRDTQWRAIRQFQQTRHIPVYYLLYNPWTVPFSQTFPLTHRPSLGKRSSVGYRIIPSDVLMSSLSDRPNSYSPQFRDVCGLLRGPVRNRSGWRIEYFISRLFLGCTHGRIFRDAADDDIESLFFGRSGPIAAAIGINVEMPEHVEWIES